ncbi:MAG: DUF1223 domain-containing protein [Acidobacteriaceae bacterium]|jgi:hypothetical protein
MMRSLAVLTLTAMAGVAWHAGPPPDMAKTPILLELFTSEGCSSCPPVDNWAERLDAAQPIAGAQLIVLSEHVDYWDHDGWRDPFSSGLITARQRGYMQMLGLSDVYTPQVILDGAVEVHPWKVSEVKQGLQKAAEEPMIPLHIEGAALTAGEPGELTGRIEAEGSAQKHGGDVYVAVALDKTETDVLAGENNGKKLTNVAVVKDLAKIGKLEKGKSFDQTFRVKLWQGADPSNLRVVAFVQEPGQGKVLGAAMTKEIARGAS